MNAKKTGRPSNNENREPMTKYSFLADAETTAALAQLEAATTARTHALRPRSAVIRQAIIEAARRLSDDL